jgi:hypothetical protein
MNSDENNIYTKIVDHFVVKTFFIWYYLRD